MSEYIAKCNEVVGISGKTLIVPDYIDMNQEIVRCMDCKHMHTVRDWTGYDVDECWLHADRESGALGKNRTEPDGFCAWAERKEGGE